MNTPICDFVAHYQGSHPTRFHMPGHKGKGPLGIEAWDITEIQGADDLSHAVGIILESEENASRLFGSRHTFYSTQGSTQCIKAMLHLALLHAPADRVGKGHVPKILAGRNAHKAFLHGCALLGLDPVWLYPRRSAPLCACPITPSQLEETLSRQKPLPIAVYVTSPDYLGGMLDIAALSQVCRRFRVPLLVDNAHGAYLKFLTPSRHPLDLGADMACDSAHKTLPVLTGGAYLHISRQAAAPYQEAARQSLALFGSSSPSYLTLASLDACNALLAEGYPGQIRSCALQGEETARRLSTMGIPVRQGEPLKLTLDMAQGGWEGEEVAQRLRANRVEPEYVDRDFLVLMLAPQNAPEDFDRLVQALAGITPGIPRSPRPLPGPCPAVLSPRQALLSPRRPLPVRQSEGKICADPAVSCPPAIPLCVSGEEITRECADLMVQWGWEEIQVVDRPTR